MDRNEILLEKQKEELNYFYGSRAFQLMKSLSSNDVKNYITVGEIAYDGSSEFKWIREYRRCKFIYLHFTIVISKAFKNDNGSASSTQKNYN